MVFAGFLQCHRIETNLTFSIFCNWRRDSLVIRKKKRVRRECKNHASPSPVVGARKRNIPPNVSRNSWFTIAYFVSYFKSSDHTGLNKIVNCYWKSKSNHILCLCWICQLMMSICVMIAHDYFNFIVIL